MSEHESIAVPEVRSFVVKVNTDVPLEGATNVRVDEEGRLIIEGSERSCLCGVEDFPGEGCWHFGFGYEFCRGCNDHHRPPVAEIGPICPVDLIINQDEFIWRTSEAEDVIDVSEGQK